jgi:serine phosphatase RsbU (regulator of sigma subunit)
VIPSLSVSGDFVDYFQIDDRYIGFYIADVSGHGSASAFVTMMLKSLFNHPIRQYRTKGDDTVLHPDKVLHYLNREMLSANVGKHVTLFLAVIDTETNSLSYSVGGHFPRPLILTGNQRYILEERGFPVGLFNWASYDAFQLDIESEFSMFLFSDGVLESMELSGIAPESKLLTLKLDHKTQTNDIIEQLNAEKMKQLPDDVSIFILHRELP